MNCRSCGCNVGHNQKNCPFCGTDKPGRDYSFTLICWTVIAVAAIIIPLYIWY